MLENDKYSSRNRGFRTIRQHTITRRYTMYVLSSVENYNTNSAVRFPTVIRVTSFSKLVGHVLADNVS